MNLNLAWSLPSPTPNCGFKALYRRKGDPSYTEIDTSGTTLTIPIAAPANYEGLIVSDCCNDDSSGTPFGVNSYVPVTVTGATNGSSHLIITVTSPFASSYATIITGTVTLNNMTQVAFSVTYSAGNISQTFDKGAVSYPPNTPVVALSVSAVSPVFDNGGQLQQFDAINTPPYFEFYWTGNISGSTWNGSPLSLPSFTLDSFTATEMAPDGVTILAGQLNMSYVVDSVFANAFTSMLLQIYDPLGSSPIGSVVVNKSPLGVRTASVILTKATSPLTPATAFTIKATWPDLTLFDTKTFNLPS